MTGAESHNRSIHTLIQAARRDADAFGTMPVAPPLPVDAVPGFELLEERGRGGMGVVYLANQLSTKRVVALKVMLAGGFASSHARQRFQREIELAARLQHPGIVRVLESGQTATGLPYYAMDNVDGVSLADWCAITTPDVPTILCLFRKLCDAVAHAHAHDVLHRDLKPANVLIDADGNPHVLDFGLAKALDTADSNATAISMLSSPGQVVGTLAYLSPEQAAGCSDAVSVQADVYALGVMLFEALTESLPYDVGGSPGDIIARIHDGPPRLPSSLCNRVDRDLDTILLKALETERGRRYQSVAEFGADIDHYLRQEPILAHRPSRLYVLRKRLIRHKLLLVSTVVVLLAGVAALRGGLRWREHSLELKQQRTDALATARREALYIQCQMETSRAELALEEANLLLRQYPQLPEAHLVVAQARFRTGWEAGDHVIIAKAIDYLKESSFGSPSRWVFYVLLAEMCDRIGCVEEAHELAASARREMPDTAEAAYLASYATMDMDKARSRLEEAVHKNPSHRLAWLRLARVCQRLEQYDRALQAVRELLALDGESYEWMMLEAHTYTMWGCYHDAVEQFTRIISRFPGRRDPFRYRGGVHLCLGEYQQAIGDYSQALELAPENRWILYSRSTPRWMVGDVDEAVRDFRGFRSLRQTPNYADARLFLILNEQARLLDREGEQAAAEQKRAEAREALDAGRRGALAGTWFEKVFSCLAEEHTPDWLVEQADPAKPEEGCEAAYYAGEVCLLNGQVDAAREWFQKCVATMLELDCDEYPPNPMNEYHLARWRLDTLPQPPAPADSQPAP